MKKHIVLALFLVLCLMNLNAFQEQHGVTIISGRTSVPGLHLWENFYIAFSRSIREGQDCEVSFSDGSKFHAIVQKQVNDVAILKTLSESQSTTPLGMELNYTPKKGEKVTLIPSSHTRGFVTESATVYKPLLLQDQQKAYAVSAPKLPAGGSFLICNSANTCIGMAFFDDENPLLSGKITLENKESIFFYRPITESILENVFGTSTPMQLDVELSSIGRNELRRPSLTPNNTLEYFHKNIKYSLDLEKKSESSLYQHSSTRNELFYLSENKQFSFLSSSLYIEEAGSQEKRLPPAIRVSAENKILYSDDDVIVLLGNNRNVIDFKIINTADGSFLQDLKDIVNAFYQPEKGTFLVFTKDDKNTEYNKDGSEVMTLPVSPIQTYDSNAQLVLGGKGVISDNIIYDIESGDPFYELPPGFHLSTGSHKDCLVGFETNSNSTTLKIIENQKVNYQAKLPFGQIQKLHYLENKEKKALIGEFDGFSIQIPWEIFNTGGKDSWEPFFISGLKRKPDVEYFKYYEDWVFTFEESSAMQIDSIEILSSNTLLQTEGKTLTYFCKNKPINGQDVKLQINYDNGKKEICQFLLEPFSYERLDEVVNQSCQMIDFESKDKVVFYQPSSSTIYIHNYPPEEKIDQFKLPKKADRIFESRGKLVAINYSSCTTMVVDLNDFEKTKTYSIKNVSIHDTYMKSGKIYALALLVNHDTRQRYDIHFQLSDYDELPKKINGLRTNGKSEVKQIGDEELGLAYKEFSSGDKNSISIAWRGKGSGITENHPVFNFATNNYHRNQGTQQAFYVSSSKLQFQNSIYKISSGSVYLDEQFDGSIFIDLENDIIYNYRKNILFVLSFPDYDYISKFEFEEGTNASLRKFDDNYLILDHHGQIKFLNRKTQKIDPNIDFNGFEEPGSAWLSENWFVVKRGEILYWIPKKPIETETTSP